MSDDSNSCLQDTTKGEWPDWTCSDAKGYCTGDWEKDPRRCCPTTCKNSSPFDNVKCEASDSDGTCTYPNDAQCPFKGRISRI